jgi:hypothetical protein
LPVLIFVQRSAQRESLNVRRVRFKMHVPLAGSAVNIDPAIRLSLHNQMELVGNAVPPPLTEPFLVLTEVSGSATWLRHH